MVGGQPSGRADWQARSHLQRKGWSELLIEADGGLGEDPRFLPGVDVDRPYTNSVAWPGYRLMNIRFHGLTRMTVPA
jgi:hypothetical protein